MYINIESIWVGIIVINVEEIIGNYYQSKCRNVIQSVFSYLNFEYNFFMEIIYKFYSKISRRNSLNV